MSQTQAIPATPTDPASRPLPSTELDVTYRRIAYRLVPFLVVLFILAWIDRVNVGFAKLSMLQDLQFSEAVYGLGAGIWTRDLGRALGSVMAERGKRRILTGKLSSTLFWLSRLLPNRYPRVVQMLS